MLWFGAVVWGLSVARIVNAPDFAVFSLLGLFVKFSDQPLGYIIAAVVGLGLIFWPYWMLTSERGKTAFGLADSAPRQRGMMPGWAKGVLAISSFVLLVTVVSLIPQRAGNGAANPPHPTPAKLMNDSISHQFFRVVFTNAFSEVQ